MCGISGIVGRICQDNRFALKRMNDALLHRGPDAEGYWEATPNKNGWGPMLAHRRLAILDLSPTGAQPMVDLTSGDVLVQNGEIYNFISLRSQLSALGHHVQSSGDAAVMLRALSVHGSSATSSMRGMYAFAYWNVQKRQLLLGRDPLGIKPLYLTRNPDPKGDWSIAFASEVRALLASGLLASRNLSAEAVASVVWNGFTVGPQTAVAGVESLWPGEQICFTEVGSEVSRERFWSMPNTDSQSPISELDMAEVLSKTVKLHLTSDVPLGVFLSGGIDSSVIANLAQKGTDSPIHTFTLAFEEAERNEGEFSKEIARAIGTNHTEVVLTQQYFMDHLDDALNSLDQPSFDGLNSYFMSHAVRDAGVKVALVGSGGDELFGGYTSFRDLPTLQRLARMTNILPMSLKFAAAKGIAGFMHRGTTAFSPQTRWAKLPDIVRCKDDLIALYQMAYALFLPSFQNELFANPESQVNMRNGLPIAMQEQLLSETRGRTALEAIAILEQRLFLGERLLRDTDAVSMSASIEIRLPLVDQTLLTEVNRIPEKDRFVPIRRKEMLRRIGLRGLDPKLFDRPKSGFELPYDRWMLNSLAPAIDETLTDRNAVLSAGLDPKAVLRLWTAFRSGSPGLYWSRVWALYVLVRWCRLNRVSM